MTFTLQNHIVIGTGPVSDAFARILGLFGKRDSYLFHSELFDQTESYHLDKIRIILRQCSLIITEGVSPLRNINIVNKLRTDFCWCGSYIGIVENSKAKKELTELSLLGEPGKYLFGSVPGHVTLAQPICLSELLQAVQEIKELEVEQWFHIVDSCSVRQIIKDLHEADNALKRAESEKAHEVLKKIMKNFGEIYWPVLLKDPHKDINVANELIDDYYSSGIKRHPALIDRIFQFFENNVAVNIDVS